MGFDVLNNVWNFVDIVLALGISLDGGCDVGFYVYDECCLFYFGCVQYDFDGKYLLSVMFCWDVFIKFGLENWVGIFLFFIVGWVLFDEDFFNLVGKVDLVKFCVSYGILGNDQIVNNGYIGILSGEVIYVFDGVLVNGIVIGVLFNLELQWEEVEKFNVGIDLAFFDYKINIIVDYFINIWDNLLIFNIFVFGIIGIFVFGVVFLIVNVGLVCNQGLEFFIGYQQWYDNELKVNFNYNFIIFCNEVLEVNNGIGFIEGGVFGVGQLALFCMEVGQLIGYFFGYQMDGIF